MKDNIVLHNYSRSENTDKVYMCCIRKDNFTNKYLLIGKYGRRGKKMTHLVLGKYDTLLMAFSERKKLVRKKVSTGYVDVEGSAYDELVLRCIWPRVSMSDPEINIHLENSFDTDAPPVSPPVAPPVVPDIDRGDCRGNVLGGDDLGVECNERPVFPFEVMCVDNVGFESMFDVGITYVAEYSHELDRFHMISVFDKYGIRGEFFKSRFEEIIRGSFLKSRSESLNSTHEEVQ